MNFRSTTFSRLAFPAALAVALGVSASGCVANVSASRRDAERIEGLESRVSNLEDDMGSLERRYARLESDLGNQIAMLRDEMTLEVAAAAAPAEPGAESEGEGKGAGGAAPVPAADGPAASPAASELAARLAEMGVTLDAGKNRVTVAGVLAAPDSPLEFALTTERGKTHETLLVVKCTPSALNAGLIALGLTPGRPFEIKEQVTEEEKKKGSKFEVEDFDTKTMHDLWYFTPQGPLVAVTVSWTDGEKTVSRRLEEMIFDLSTEKAMEPAGFVYLGSRMDEDRDGKAIYVADFTGDLVAVYHSFQGNAILDTPLLQGRDDTIFVPYREKLPPRGTKVDVSFEPLAAAPK